MTKNAGCTIKKQYQKIILISICALFNLIAFYPGFMSIDSLAQYEISKSFIFNDWHPPIMSWVWSILNLFFPEPSGMLFFHIFLFWLSIYIWWSKYQDRSYSCLFILIGFLPWILNFSGVIWKDIGMAFSLLMLTSLSLFRPSSGKIILAFMLAFYAINLRHNAIFAALSIVFILIHSWYPKLSNPKVILSTIASIYFMVILGGWFNYNFLNAQRTNPSSYIMTDDLLHLSIIKNKSLIPGTDLADLQICAASEIGQNKLVGKSFCLLQSQTLNETKVEGDQLKQIWLSNIFQNPIAYIKFRLAAFSYLLRTPSDPPYYIWHQGIDENKLGIRRQLNIFTLITEGYIKISANYLFPFAFKPYWWLIVSIAVLTATFIFESTESVRLAQALLVSSISYVFLYIPLTPMADFRYIYWSVLASTLALFILFIDFKNYKKSKSLIKRYSTLLISMFMLTLIYNFGGIVAINSDAILQKNLIHKHIIPVAIQPNLNHLELVDGTYVVKGVHPYLVFNVNSMHITTNNLDYIHFNFLCHGHKFRPQIQLFWWGDNQNEPFETQSKILNFNNGINLIPVVDTFKSLHEIMGIRLDLVDSNACTSITINNVSFIKG